MGREMLSPLRLKCSVRLFLEVQVIIRASRFILHPIMSVLKKGVGVGVSLGGSVS